MAQDYILRLIEQVVLMLAELSGLKTAERPARISALTLRETGLPLDIIKKSSPETILQLLETGGGTQHARAILLAELLLQDADLSEAAGKNREATISRAQAQALLAHSIDKLSPEEQLVYRPRLEALTADLTRAVRQS
jgi:hypothetical protein